MLKSGIYPHEEAEKLRKSAEDGTLTEEDIKSFQEKVIPVTILQGNELALKKGQASFTVYSLSYMDKFEKLMRTIQSMVVLYQPQAKDLYPYMKEEEIDQFEKSLSDCYDSCIQVGEFFKAFIKRESDARREKEEHEHLMESFWENMLDKYPNVPDVPYMLDHDPPLEDKILHRLSYGLIILDLHGYSWRENIEKYGDNWDPFDPSYKEDEKELKNSPWDPREDG